MFTLLCLKLSFVQFAWCLAQGGITLAYFTDPALEYFQFFISFAGSSFNLSYCETF